MSIMATILVVYMKHDRRFVEIILQKKAKMKSVIQIEKGFRVKFRPHGALTRSETYRRGRDFK